MKTRRVTFYSSLRTKIVRRTGLFLDVAIKTATTRIPIAGSASIQTKRMKRQIVPDFGKEAVIGILAAVAKQERVRLSRTKAGMESAKAYSRVGVARRLRMRSQNWWRRLDAEVGKSSKYRATATQNSSGGTVVQVDQNSLVSLRNADDRFEWQSACKINRLWDKRGGQSVPIKHGL